MKPHRDDSIFFLVAQWRAAAQELPKDMVTATELHVLGALIDHADMQGGSIYPSNERLALETRLDARTIKRARVRLLDLGVLVDTGERRAVRRPDGQTYRADVYRLGDVLLEPLRGRPLHPDLSRLRPGDTVSRRVNAQAVAVEPGGTTCHPVTTRRPIDWLNPPEAEGTL